MESQISKSCVIRGVEYIIVMEVRDGHMTVEVEERATADQWRNTFSPEYIEDMTQKTGNFKKFSVFVSMLESVISKSTEAVSLDLLTYGDLELLRSRKVAGYAASQTIPSAKTASALSSKRYLIVTYSVEFDRVHYPLPLLFMGKPDPRALQQTIRQLKKEIKLLQQQVLKDYRVKEIDSLKRDCDRLAKEKESIEAAFVEYKRELELTNEASAAKEVRILKGMVKNLEEELATERSKHQRSTTKRSQQYRQLVDELDEVRASERNLRTRVKSLMNELAQYKRKGSRAFPGSLSYSRPTRETLPGSRNNSSRSDRSHVSNQSAGSNRSRVSDFGVASNRERSGSRERSCSRERSVTRGRSSSLDRLSRSNDRSRDWLARNTMIGSSSHRTRTPSPGTRFDPTAYAADRKRQLKEIELKRKRTVKGRMSGSTERKRKPSPARSTGFSSQVGRTVGGLRDQPSRSSSIGSTGSLASSVESLSEIIGPDSDSSLIRLSGGGTRAGRVKSLGLQSNGLVNRDAFASQNGKKREQTYTFEFIAEKTANITFEHQNDNESYNRSTELSDIDERLNRLQEFMKANLKQ